jgi:hypothetical protein
MLEMLMGFAFQSLLPNLKLKPFLVFILPCGSFFVFVLFIKKSTKIKNSRFEVLINKLSST